MPKYDYINCCLTGVLGVSDYIFACEIEADDEAQALEWGHEVAKEYDRRYGLQPSGRRMDDVSIEQNGEVLLATEKDRANAMKCEVGEMPDFEGVPMIFSYHCDNKHICRF